MLKSCLITLHNLHNHLSSESRRLDLSDEGCRGLNNLRNSGHTAKDRSSPQNLSREQLVQPVPLRRFHRLSFQPTIGAVGCKFATPPVWVNVPKPKRARRGAP